MLKAQCAHVYAVHQALEQVCDYSLNCSRGSANCVELVHWAMRNILSLSALSYILIGRNGLTFLRGHKQC